MRRIKTDVRWFLYNYGWYMLALVTVLMMLWLSGSSMATQINSLQWRLQRVCVAWMNTPKMPLVPAECIGALG